MIYSTSLRLHCSVLASQLYFWGHGAGKGIAETLEALGLEKAPRKKELRNAVLWMPDEKGERVDAWERNVLACSWDYWWYFFENARFRRAGNAQEILGADLRFWLTVSQLAERLLAEGSYLPGILAEERGYRAVWEPLLLRENREHFWALESAMPDSARALSFSRKQAPETPRAEALREALREMVNAGVRQVAPHEHRFAGAGSYGRWLSSLHGPFGDVGGEASVLARLAKDLSYWKAGLSGEEATGGRLALQLQEPASDDQDWRLSIAWRTVEGEEYSFAELPTEHTSLAWRCAEEAARVYAPLSRLGQANWTGGLSLGGEAVVEFVEHWAEELRAGGFSVQGPGWFSDRERKAIRLTGKLRAAEVAPEARFSLDALVELDWSVSVDETMLGQDEIIAIAARKSPLQKVAGKWMIVDRAGIEAAANFLARNRDRQMRLREALKIALGLSPVEASVELGGLEAEGWVKQFLDQLLDGERVRQMSPPESLRGTLRPYQVRGYSWLSFLTRFGMGACLADDMGLGKSIQTLALFLERKTLRQEPALLLCPTSVIGNWEREAQKFAPDLRVLVHHGIQRRKKESFLEQAREHDVVVASYALAHRDEETLQQIEWDGVVLDEAQNIKNSEAKQSQAIRGLRAGYKVALTGTPVENHVGDLYSLMQFLNPGHLGSGAEFQRRFFVPIQKRGDPQASRLLKKLTAPFVLRRLKTDRNIIADLPEKLEMKVFCKLTKEQARLYDDVVRAQFREIQQQTGIARRGSILATLLKLKQVCNHPLQVLPDDGVVGGRSGKLARLEEMLEEIRENGEKALIFTQFAEMGTILASYLSVKRNEPVFYLYGGTKREERDRMVDEFQQESGPGLFVLSLKAGGTGLNLTAATHVFHFDRWWNPAVENQATDRAYRIGQTRKVEVHKFLTMGTVEERIDLMLEHKKQLAEKIVDGGETWLTEMSNDELRELFQLSEDARAD